MMMIASAGQVGEITPAIQPAVDAGVNREGGRPASLAVGFAVHERWMNGPFLGVTDKLWGEPCEFEKSP
jgi:hypothetical protein